MESSESTIRVAASRAAVKLNTGIHSKFRFIHKLNSSPVGRDLPFSRFNQVERATPERGTLRTPHLTQPKQGTRRGNPSCRWGSPI